MRLMRAACEFPTDRISWLPSRKFEARSRIIGKHRATLRSIVVREKTSVPRGTGDYWKPRDLRRIDRGEKESDNSPDPSYRKIRAAAERTGELDDALPAECGDPEETARNACTRDTSDACGSDASAAHQRESLTGAGVETDRRDSLLFHFISSPPPLFWWFLFELAGRMTRVSAARPAKERERGRAAARARR